MSDYSDIENIFGRDYVTDSLFDEEDEEAIGLDFHTNPEPMSAQSAQARPQGSNQLTITISRVAKLPDSMKKQGITRAILKMADGSTILLK